MAPLPLPGSLTVVDDIEQAVSDVDFVQESAPEQEQLKRELLARASVAAAPETVFASSTSGLLPSRLQIDMAHPERLVVGHPFIDVWQGVKPERIGLDAWPVIPRGIEWKHGICAALGWPHADQADIAAAWRRILDSVRDYRDLEPELLGRVEELIDFTTTL